MDHPNAEDLLQVPLLAGLSAAARESLAGALEVEEHASGHVIVRQGQSGYAFFVLGAGSAEVSVDGRHVRDLGPGDYFGEMAIMGEGRRTATVTARSDLTAWVLFGTGFRGLQVDQPEVADALETALKDRLSTA